MCEFVDSAGGLGAQSEALSSTVSGPADDSGDIRSISSQELGKRGEDRVASWLVEKGWTILYRNWRCDVGEIDIVAYDPEGNVSLIEVKTRLALGEHPERCSGWTPEDAVDEDKQRRYELLAQVFLRCNPEVRSIRFDVVALSVTGFDRAHIRYIKNAFERPGA